MTLTGNLSYIASILVAKLNFTHVRTQKLRDTGTESTLRRGRLSNGVFEGRASSGHDPLYLKIFHYNNASKVELLSSIVS